MVTRVAPLQCSVMKALEVVGERWTLLVVREAFNGVRRFEGFLANVGCARNLLAARLATLVEHGVLVRVPYLEAGRRERFEYRLTAKGRSLYPVLLALMAWGDRWLQPTPGEGPVEVLHRGCGAPVVVELRCAAGHLLTDPREGERRLRSRATRRARPRVAATAPAPAPGRRG
jgi:DNA-binding HxlR family transcriptional regulator